MVYKNEYEYLYALAGGIFFGVIMTLRMGVAGVFAGVIFGIIIFLFTSFTSAKVEKAANTLRNEISQVRHVICDGPATYLKDKKAIGGWLFLSEDALEFYPHKYNTVGENIPILLDDIEGVDIKKNQLVIRSKIGEYKFVVFKSKLWKQTIMETV